MENVKIILTKLFQAEPFSKKREVYYKRLKDLEKELNISTYHVYIDNNTKVKVDILEKEKGLYKKIDELIIDNIKVIDLSSKEV